MAVAQPLRTPGVRPGGVERVGTVIRGGRVAVYSCCWSTLKKGIHRRVVIGHGVGVGVAAFGQ